MLPWLPDNWEFSATIHIFSACFCYHFERYHVYFIAIEMPVAFISVLVVSGRTPVLSYLGRPGWYFNPRPRCIGGLSSCSILLLMWSIQRELTNLDMQKYVFDPMNSHPTMFIIHWNAESFKGMNLVLKSWKSAFWITTGDTVEYVNLQPANYTG